MRLKLYEDAIRAKTKTTTKGDKTIDPCASDDSHAEAASPTRAAAETPVPAEDRPDMEAEAAASQGGPPLRPPTRAPKPSDSGSVPSATAAAPTIRPMPSRQGPRWFIRFLKDFGKKPLS